MTQRNPLADDAPSDAEDTELARLALAGSKDALERIVVRHQQWIYNIALRMLAQPQDAEDAAQEILVKVITRLSTFRGESLFRTWLYRVAANHLLNLKRGGTASQQRTFDAYRRELHDIVDVDWVDEKAVSAESRLLIDEARIGCTTAMLLCLDSEQRLVYVLGAVFGVSDRVGAELLNVSRDNFRQKLARARRDLRAFMNDECGLVKTSNPCRCARKTEGFIKAGYIDSTMLVFARERTLRVREIAASRSEMIDEFDVAYAEIHRSHPFQPSPDFVASLRTLIQQSDFHSIFDI